MGPVNIPEEMRERLTRWLEDGQTQLGLIRCLLDDYERLQGVAEAAERECERLRGCSTRPSASAAGSRRRSTRARSSVTPSVSSGARPNATPGSGRRSPPRCPAS
jgi:hypothetical protein